MKSHMLLLRTVLNEMGTRCCTSTLRDFKRITKRVEHEGMSFLTISLSDFCEDFQQALARGRIDSTLFAGQAKDGYLPKFLSGFTSQVFDRSTGVLLSKPSTEAIYAVRQVCLLFGKVNLPCSDARKETAFRKFVECERQVTSINQSLTSEQLFTFAETADRLLASVFTELNQAVYDGEIVPKHGPGSTADRLFGNEKYDQKVWTERLENELFYAGEFLFPSWGHYDPQLVTWLEPDQELPVRVVSVPKTLKTPRIIAIEPTCMQYVQQGLMEVIVRNIGRDRLLSEFIGFDNQTPNREMARTSSIYGDLATLDLREASDRVSNQLVQFLMARFPHASRAVQACRSRNADVPGYGVIPLSKFASMGSALCFPMEAMVFFTLVIMGIERVSNTPFSRRTLKDLVGKVRVFGDDIIVPEEYVHSVVDTLEAFGLIVNSTKSFWTGRFRESCGKEYYAGDDVSVVRCRAMLPATRRHVPEIISAVSLRNQMYFAGNWETAKFLDEWLGKLIPFPTVSQESPALGRHTFLPYESNKKERMSNDLHKPLVWAYRESSRIPPSPLEGSGALLKFFLKRSAEPSADWKHLERAGRPKAVNIKLGWVPAD